MDDDAGTGRGDRLPRDQVARQPRDQVARQPRDVVARTHRDVVSYVRRSARMNQSQQNALDRLGDRLIIDVARGDLSTSVAPQPPVDWASHFGRRAPLVVEIGSGTGDALAAMAAAHPDWDFVGFEVFWAGVASTLIKLGSAGVTNTRVVVADGVAGLRELFAPGSVHRVVTFFPDPWPKVRHHKRRLIDAGFAELVASRVEPGGEWFIATDWDDYAAWIAEALAAVPAWEPVAGGDGHAARFAERPVTRFEGRGVAAGRTIHDFWFRRAA